MKPIQIQIKSLSRAFNNIDILKELDLYIKTGETIAVMGESGIGKSTFLHLLGALDRPDSGTITFQGKNIFDMSNNMLAEFRNQSIGFVFQFHHLLPEFSAIENTMIPAMINNKSKQKAKDMAESILLKVGLKQRLYYNVAKLSGGERQRVALARALVNRPSLLLADEPTGNLDIKNSEQVHELLAALNKDLKMTIIVVTHDAKLASYMSRIVTITDGKIKEIKSD